MADAKIYVEISKFSVKEIFDDKHKGRVINLMTTAAEAAVKKSGKLSLDKPKDKGAKGWNVIGSLVSLGPSRDCKKFGAKVSLAVATWPGKSIKAMPSSEIAFNSEPGDKISASDVDEVAMRAVAEAMQSAVKFMESKKPE
jgi:hypothetical protein